MIHVIDEMHLNDFKEVHTVKPCDLYARYGKRTSPVSFDSNIEYNVPMNLRKLDSIEYLEAFDAMMQPIEHDSSDSHEASHSETEEES